MRLGDAGGLEERRGTGQAEPKPPGWGVAAAGSGREQQGEHGASP